MNRGRRVWAAENRHRVWASTTINGHRRHGYLVEIDVDQLTYLAQCSKRCNICRCELDWSANKGKTRANSPTLDRTDNDQLMTLRSIQIICQLCNRSKGERTMAQFIEYCTMVAGLAPIKIDACPAGPTPAEKRAAFAPEEPR